ncbi:hypothetical protein FJT64_008169 [Amphibalanus amphitrite]|uniref:Apple domain-containing protein n=1 Tax=Amphibalanus amphitrite TaxID=1232801 RepID=A0A6A4VTS3_AMPAM|nr:hypothetical protein FJT64_008169 [Amphibalanus amphitrite]
MSITTSPPLVCLLLLLSLTWLTSGVTGDDAAVFLRAGTSLSLPDASAAPHSAVWAGSLATCALACVAVHSRLCRGVTFSAAERSCLMHTACTERKLIVEPINDSGRVSYRRLFPKCTAAPQHLPIAVSPSPPPIFPTIALGSHGPEDPACRRRCSRRQPVQPPAPVQPPPPPRMPLLLLLPLPPNRTTSAWRPRHAATSRRRASSRRTP